MIEIRVKKAYIFGLVDLFTENFWYDETKYRFFSPRIPSSFRHQNHTFLFFLLEYCSIVTVNKLFV